MFVHGDICDRALLDRLFAEHRPRAVVHFAAESHVDRSIHGPAAFIQTNVEGTFTLLEAARAHWPTLDGGRRRRRSASSTSRPTRSTARSRRATRRSPRTDIYEPNSPYSASKAASDHLVRAWHHTYGLPVLTTNCSNNYGPFHFPEKLIPLMIVNALAGKPLPVYGDGQQVRDWLYVKDHCAAIRAVLARGRVGETYNVGGWNEKPNIEIVHTVCALLDELRPDPAGSYSRLITHVTDRPGHDRRYAIDARKIERELGWKPAETFETGIRKTVRWYLDHADWVARVQSGAYRDWVATNYAERAPRVKILLLGKNGQVGWELQRALAPLGDVVALGFDSPAPLTADFSPARVARRHGARRGAADHRQRRRPHRRRPRREPSPSSRALVNADGARPCWRAEAKRGGAWLLHYSTDYVFDGSGSAPWMEDSPTGPLSVYGATKLEGEEAIRASGCRHLILRTSWVYAARGGNFAKTMLKLANERDKLRVIDDQIGAPTGADLLADITAHAAHGARSAPSRSPGTYHAVAAGETSWHGYARHVIDFARAAGQPIKVAPEAIEPVPTSAFPTPAAPARQLAPRHDASCAADLRPRAAAVAGRRRAHARRNPDTRLNRP